MATLVGDDFRKNLNGGVESAAYGEQSSTAYAYVLGAVLVVIILVALLNAFNPSNKLDYLAVIGASLTPSSSQAYDALRTDDVLQVVMLIVGVLIAAVLGMTRKNKLLGNVIFSAAAVIALALIVFRSASVLHLDVYFWLLALAYVAVAAAALFIAVELFIRAKSTGERVVGALMVLLGVIFGAAAFGAVTVAVKVKSGDDAQAIVDAAAGGFISSGNYSGVGASLNDISVLKTALDNVAAYVTPGSPASAEPALSGIITTYVNGIKNAIQQIPGGVAYFNELNTTTLNEEVSAILAAIATGTGTDVTDALTAFKLDVAAFLDAPTA